MYTNRLSPYYIYTFLMVMWSCRTSRFWDLYSSTSIMTIIWIIVNIYFYVNFCKNTNYKPLFLFTTIFVIWYILSCIKYISLLHFGYPLLYDFFVIFIAYNFLKKHFFGYYQQVVTDLSFVCLIVWFGALLFPNIVPALVRSISVTPVGNLPMDCNFYIVGLSGQFEEGIRRNLGFTWEPGRYSCFLLLALFANLTTYRFQIRRNYNFWVLSISLLSTLSTTGYAAYSIIILYYLYNTRYSSSRILTITALTIVVPSILALSFMQNKIEDVMTLNYNQNNISHDISYQMLQNNLDVIVPQRGLSLWIDFQNFVHDPVLGYSEVDRSFCQVNLFKNFRVLTTNGILKIFANYGFFVGVFFYLSLFSSSILYARQMKVKGRLFLMILFISISISYDFWNGVFLYFAFYSLFHYNRVRLSFN